MTSTQLFRTNEPNEQREEFYGEEGSYGKARIKGMKIKE